MQCTAASSSQLLHTYFAQRLPELHGKQQSTGRCKLNQLARELWHCTAHLHTLAHISTHLHTFAQIHPRSLYLHGVHGNVHAAVNEGIVNLLGEKTLAADVSQRAIQHLVAGSFDDHQLQRAFLRELRGGSLKPRRKAIMTTIGNKDHATLEGATQGQMTAQMDHKYTRVIV